jgi:hypothetical protein
MVEKIDTALLVGTLATSRTSEDPIFRFSARPDAE